MSKIQPNRRLVVFQNKLLGKKLHKSINKFNKEGKNELKANILTLPDNKFLPPLKYQDPAHKTKCVDYRRPVQVVDPNKDKPQIEEKQ